MLYLITILVRSGWKGVRHLMSKSMHESSIYGKGWLQAHGLKNYGKIQQEIWSK
jgi:hypothetical protein